MNTTANFRIKKSTYINLDGVEENTYFFIEQRKTFLGIPYWIELKHIKLSSFLSRGGLVEIRTKFNDYNEAVKHIEDILCKGIKPDTYVETVVDYIKCGK